MDQPHVLEMKEMLENLERDGALRSRHILLFGHADASLTLADELLSRGYRVEAILDNSGVKQGILYRGIPVRKPDSISEYNNDETIVCIASRFFESMRTQLRGLGFTGRIEKLVDYNSYAAYDLSEETVSEKRRRVEHGKTVIQSIEQRHPGCFRVYCPFAALGDVFIMMSYLPHFLKKRFAGREAGIPKPVVCVSSAVCAEVVALFEAAEAEILSQADLDAAVQASLFTRDKGAFIAHQDRPYVVNLSRALYLKKIPLEQIYCCGVFGLPKDTKPVRPAPDRRRTYPELAGIQKGKAVIFSPYAKSVQAIDKEIWVRLVKQYGDKRFQMFTNVAPGEAPLDGTDPICPEIAELQSVVEHAGTFIGIRNGLCDILKDADCRKIALYPDYYYMDTKWKAIEMYGLDGWNNIETVNGVDDVLRELS